MSHNSSLMLVISAALALAASAFAQTETTVYNFQGMPDGSVPSAAPIRDSSGNLYGTTAYGGAGYGTVFKIDNKGNTQIIYTFAAGTDGEIPVAALIRDSAGNLYGTTEFGGVHSGGTVFKIDSTGKESILYNFKGTSDGALPLTALVRDGSGNLYGTTSTAGNTTCRSVLNSVEIGCGTIFRLSASGKLTVLHTYGSGSDEGASDGDMVGDSSGNLYGTTYDGGSHGYGTVYELAKNGAFTVLYSFNWGVGADGARPVGKLLRDTSGNLYGTTRYGGNYTGSDCQGSGCGTIFEVAPAGTETVLYSFKGASDGYDPEAGLIADSAGNFYGTTIKGGAKNQGTVFRLKTTGQETVLHSFVGTDGDAPIAGLVPASGGSFYGTASEGGSGAAGVVFKIIP